MTNSTETMQNKLLRSKAEASKGFRDRIIQTALLLGLTVGTSFIGGKTFDSQLKSKLLEPKLTEVEIINAASKDWFKNNPTYDKSENKELSEDLRFEHDNVYIIAARKSNNISAGKLATLNEMSLEQKQLPGIKQAITDLTQEVTQQKVRNGRNQIRYDQQKNEAKTLGGFSGAAVGTFIGGAALGLWELFKPRKQKEKKPIPLVNFEYIQRKNIEEQIGKSQLEKERLQNVEFLNKIYYSK